MIGSLELFDLQFGKILSKKILPEIPRMRIYLEEISEVRLKALFLREFVERFAEHKSFFVKILFWESPNDFIEKVLISKFRSNKINITRQTKVDSSDPCIVWFNGDKLEPILLEEMILWHFNFELAENPSANMRIQFCLINSIDQILWDVYDDRGCDVYWFKKNTNYPL